MIEYQFYRSPCRKCKYTNNVLPCMCEVSGKKYVPSENLEYLEYKFKESREFEK